MFSDDQEKRLAQEIQDHDLYRGHIVTGADFKRTAIDAYYGRKPFNPGQKSF
jgi:hypothetical protein